MKFRAIEKNKGMYLTISFDINFGKARLRGKTNLSVHRDCVKTFNPITLKTTPDFTQSERLEILGKLNSFELFVEKTKATLKSQNLSNPDAELKDQIEIYFGRTKEQEDEKTMSLFQFMDYYIDLKENQRFSKNGIVKAFHPTTILEYKRFKRLLKQYVDEKNISFNYRNVNAQFEVDFTEFCRKLQYKSNTIGKFFKIIKLFMNKANADGHHNNLKFKSFPVLREKVSNDYLNEAELEELFNKRLEFPEIELPKIDYFLLMSYTSLRVMDMLRLRKKNIIVDEIPLIEYIESKNSKAFYFPINNKVQTILDFYDGGFPNDVINQKVNKGSAINDVMRKAIRHKKITCHSGRRSYVNNEIIKGTPYDDIIRQTRHSSRAVFEAYVSQSSDKELLKARARREYK